MHMHMHLDVQHVVERRDVGPGEARHLYIHIKYTYADRYKCVCICMALVSTAGGRWWGGR